MRSRLRNSCPREEDPFGSAPPRVSVALPPPRDSVLTRRLHPAWSRAAQLAAKRVVSLSVSADSKINTDEVLKTIADKWEDTENKSAVVTYVAGAAALVWLSGTVVGAINSIPVLPKVMELVGLGYSSWFVYRYVLFKDSRKELVEQFDALKNKVSGEL